MVFQDHKLLPNRTVFENVAIALQILGISAKEQEKQVGAVLERVGIIHLKNAYPLQLSGGEQQRVSLARAIVNDPPILLADEPTGNLDPETSWDIMKLIAKINLQGTTVLVSTHNQTIVDKMQRRVIQIEKGRIRRDTIKGGYAIGTS